MGLACQGLFQPGEVRGNQPPGQNAERKTDHSNVTFLHAVFFVKLHFAGKSGFGVILRISDRTLAPDTTALLVCGRMSRVLAQKHDAIP